MWTILNPPPAASSASTRCLSPRCLCKLSHLSLALAPFKCVIAALIQRAALNHCLCRLLSALRMSLFRFGTDCLFVCFFTHPCLSVRHRPAPLSVRPSSFSGQPTSAPSTPTAAGSAAFASLLPTSLTVHSFVSLHQYCCPATDQRLQQEHR